MEHAFPIRYTFLVLESETGNAGQVILNTYLDKKYTVWNHKNHLRKAEIRRFVSVNFSMGRNIPTIIFALECSYLLLQNS